MTRWFLSYHSPDQALAEGLKAALERKDPGARVFLASTSLRAGGFWSQALGDAISQADAFILLVGEKGVGDWQVPEYYEALDRRVKSPNFPVVLVLFQGQPAPGLPFLRQLHWIVTPDPASDKALARLMDAAAGRGTRPGELWRYTSPYRGLAAMEEKDSDYFFGRGAKTVEVLSALAAAPDRLPVLLGNSGVGKSSLARAGVLAALKRQAWPETAPGAWPPAFADSRRWCFLTLRPGAEPLRALVEAFLDTWQLGAIDPQRVKVLNRWIQLLHDGEATLRDLLDATERSYRELDRDRPPAFFLYIDQGEELYARADEKQRERFSQLIAQGVADPCLHALMSMRADFLGELQKDEPLYNVHRKIDVPPLREAELRDVVSRPAKFLSARFETDRLADGIARRTAEESTMDAGALPLLSYLLDDMWTQMVHRGDGVLRLPTQAIDLGGVLADRADKFLARHPNSEDRLRRIFTKLATIREDGEPTRRLALRTEFSEEEWRLVTELADHPNRLLATVTPEVGEAYTQVAHEAVFRHWDKLRTWIAMEREFLSWRSRLETDRRRWEGAPAREKHQELLMGRALSEARRKRAERATDLSEADRKFIGLSIRRVWTRRLRAVGLASAGLVAATGFAAQDRLREAVLDWPGPLSRALVKLRLELWPPPRFKECENCPQMIVVPAGEFMMGRNKVRIAKPFAVSRFEVTFDEWDACVAASGCQHRPLRAWGGGTHPVIDVSWDDAKQYAAWLERQTGKPYRLLSEAEWEYAARAGSDTAYSWGNRIGIGNANCGGCGSAWDGQQTAAVGSFAANAFGLHDMHGNVWEWVEDCRHYRYDGAPTDGRAWTTDCDEGASRVVRGGSWGSLPGDLHATNRDGVTTHSRRHILGFRVGRTLTP
jgi:formylglycine-generating enzyme required for sulfatase activity